MMKLGSKRKKRAGDSTVALINIVFLMLVFFLIAGTITPPIDDNINPVTLSDEKNAELAHMLSIRKEGELFYENAPVTVKEYWSKHSANSDSEVVIARILVDQELEAVKLVQVVAELKSLGAPVIRVVTKKQDS